MTLAALAWALAKARGNPLGAVEISKHYLRASHPHVEPITRGMVDAISLSDTDGYSVVASSFVGTFAPISPIDAMMSAAHRVPLRKAVVAVTAAMHGGAVAEGSFKPLTLLQLDGGGLDPQKAVVLCAISDEVLKFSPSSGIDFINNQMRIGLVGATNLPFLSSIANGIAPIPSSGDFWTDFAAGLAVVAGDRAAKVFAVFPRQVVIQMATMHTSDGLSVFPQLRVDGGIIAGVEVLVSDDLPQDSNGPLALIVNADGLAIGDEPLTFRTSSRADLVMEDSTSPGAQAVVSLYQSNSIALLVERQFGCQRLRDNAVAVISGADYSVPS